MAKVNTRTGALFAANPTYNSDKNLNIGVIPETTQILSGTDVLMHAVVETAGVVE